MRVVLLLLAGWAFGALLSYWWGRVLLPEVGLVAPGYWTWFWAVLPLVISAALGAAVREVMR